MAGPGLAPRAGAFRPGLPGTWIGRPVGSAGRRGRAVDRAGRRERGSQGRVGGPRKRRRSRRGLINAMRPSSLAVFACGKGTPPGAAARFSNAAGHTVRPVVVYRMVPTPPRELPPLGPSLEAVVLTSPRAASLYLEGVGGRPLPCRHFALGTTTQQAAAGLGIECRIPNEPTMESLAEELCTI